MLDLELRQSFRTRRPYATRMWHRRHRQESCSDHRRRAMSSFALCTTSTPRAFHLSKQKLARRRDYPWFHEGQLQWQRQRDLGLRKYCRMPNELPLPIRPKSQ